MSSIFMDMGKKEKSVKQIIVNSSLCPTAQSSYRDRPKKKTPNPNQEFAWESDFEHFIFMYMTDLGKELELKGKGGEK